LSDKKQGIPKTKIPIIGEKEKSEEFVRQVMAYLDPIMQNILTSIDGIERRLAVVEEVKQIFPASINVIIKKEEIDAWRSNLERRMEKLERPGK